MRVLKGKSGITILFRPMKTGLVDMRYYVKCGAVDESPSEWGYAHALEHMVYAGTSKRDWQQINRDWEKLGAYYNAETLHDRTVYLTTCLKKHWQEAYEVLADMFYNCTFPAERWEDIERPAVLSEILDDLDDEPGVLMEELYSQGIGDRYHSIVGGIDAIKKATIKDLTRFYEEYYQGDNVVLVITGDIGEKELLQAVNRYDRLQVRRPVRRKKFRFNFDYTPLEVVQPGTQQAYIQAIAPIQIPRKYRTKVALEIGVNCRSQYLFEELRERRGLVYGASSSLYWHLPGTLFLQARTATEVSNQDKTINAFKEALSNFPHDGLTAERINNMKQATIYSTINESEDIETSADWMWDAWEEKQLDGDPYEDYIRIVERLTVESIRSTTRLNVSDEHKLGKLVGQQ